MPGKQPLWNERPRKGDFSMHDFMLNAGRILHACDVYIFVTVAIALVYLDARFGAQPLQ